MKSKTTIYSVPVEDKFLVYAPLKPLAIIVNKAMVTEIARVVESPGIPLASEYDLIRALKKLGLFEPDKASFTNCECNKPFNPAQCILLLTTACNLACTYCYAARDKKIPVTLNQQTAMKAIDIAFENSRKLKKSKFSLSFHGGGEPTLARSLFFEASEYARSLDPECQISVTTNAVWDEEFRNKVLGLLTQISISCDGDEITQNRQRPDKQGNGTFFKVMETILEIEKRKIPYGIRMTVTKESLSELIHNVEFICKKTSCRSVQVEPVYNQGRAEGSGITIDDTDVFVAGFMKAYALARSFGRSLYYSGARPHLNTNVFCKATSDALIVTADGDLTACFEVFDQSHLLAEDFIIGKVDLGDGLVLYPGKRELLLKKINDNREQCEGCFCYYHCAGDCPPKAFIASLNDDQFRCSITRAITRELILERILMNDGVWKGDSLNNPRYRSLGQ